MKDDELQFEFDDVQVCGTYSDSAPYTRRVIKKKSSKNSSQPTSSSDMNNEEVEKSLIESAEIPEVAENDPLMNVNIELTGNPEEDLWYSDSEFIKELESDESIDSAAIERIKEIEHIEQSEDVVESYLTSTDETSTDEIQVNSISQDEFEDIKQIIEPEEESETCDEVEDELIHNVEEEIVVPEPETTPVTRWRTSVRCIEDDMVFRSMAEAERYYGLSSGSVSAAIKSGDAVSNMHFEKVGS